MTEVKERITDWNFEQTANEEKLELEREEEIITFPEINPFYIPWFWPTF